MKTGASEQIHEQDTQLCKKLVVKEGLMMHMVNLVCSLSLACEVIDEESSAAAVTVQAHHYRTFDLEMQTGEKGKRE